MNNLEYFLNPFVPNPCNADAYSISSFKISSKESKHYSQYYFANRYSPADVWPDVAKDSRMILYGVSDFIQEFLTTPLTRNEINESELFLNQAHVGITGLPLDRSLLEWCVSHNNGYLPIRITSLPEGSTFFPNEPVLMVENTVPGMGELCVWTEMALVGYVSTATARATRARHYLDRFIEWFRLDNSEKSYNLAKNYLHDFGGRASSTLGESRMFSRAHLLSFNSTDTFNGAYQAWRMGCNQDTGKSIIAAAHHNIMSYESEDLAFSDMCNNTTICSYVADSFNFKDAVVKLINLAKDNPSKVIVIRSDSGNHLNNCEYVLDLLISENMIGKNILYLDGDELKPEIIKLLIELCWSKGVNPTSFFAVFGNGGNLRDNATRSTLSSAYKICCVGKDYRPVVKLSEVVGKMSVPGPNYITRSWNNDYSVEYGHGKDCRKVFYDGCESDMSKRFTPMCYEDFSTLQYRCIHQFNELNHRPDNFGMPDNTCLSPKIIKIQQEYKEKYR